MAIFSTLLFFGQLLAVGPHTSSAPSARPTSHETAVSVAGRVITGDSGEPLPGVVVVVQGTPQATSTNAAGEFLLSIASTKPKLVFKCQGYRDCTMEMTSNEMLTVKMYATSQALPANAVTSGEAGTAGVTPTLSYAEEMPSFPGGEAGYRAYIRQNAHYPESALAKGISGTVFVSFVVDEQGRISDAAITKGLSTALDEEAIRVIRLMPWWSPGRVAGKPVRVSRVLPIPFVMRDRP